MQVLITVTEQIEHKRVVDITEEEYSKLYKDYMGGDMFGSYMMGCDMATSDTASSQVAWRYGHVEKLPYGMKCNECKSRDTA